MKYVLTLLFLGPVWEHNEHYQDGIVVWPVTFDSESDCEAHGRRVADVLTARMQTNAEPVITCIEAKYDSYN